MSPLNYFLLVSCPSSHQILATLLSYSTTVHVLCVINGHWTNSRGRRAMYEASTLCLKRKLSCRSILWMCEQNLKFVALSVPDIIAIAVLGSGCEPPILWKAWP